MRKKERCNEVFTLLSCLFDKCFTIGNKDTFPHSTVTELLFSIRFSCSVAALRDMILHLINLGYKPFSFPKNSKEYIQVKNIIKIIDHAQEKKNK